MIDETGFPGEPPEQRMRKLARSNPSVTCASCRQFDGLTWCRRWNYHTEPEAPICNQYKPSPTPWGRWPADPEGAGRRGPR